MAGRPTDLAVLFSACLFPASTPGPQYSTFPSSVTSVILLAGPFRDYVFSGGLSGGSRRTPSNIPPSKPILVLGSPVRVKPAFFLLLLSLAAAAAAQNVENHSGNLPLGHRQPVNTTQLTAWLAGGVPGSRLARVVSERGLANLPTHNELHQLEGSGAGKELMRVVNSGNVQSAQIGPAIPASLLKAAARDPATEIP